MAIWILESPISAKNSENFAVHFQSGVLHFPENLEEFIETPELTKQRVEKYIYRYIQFNRIPTTSQKEDLWNSGIDLHFYIPNNTFLAKIPVSLDRNKLKTWGVRSVVIPTATEKVSRRLVSQSLPDWVINGDYISLNVQYHQDLSLEWVSQKIRECGYEILDSDPYTQFVIVKLPIDNIYDLADLAFVNFVEPIDGPGEPEDIGGRTLHRANSLDSEHPLGRKYDGSGVNVLVRDDGDIGPHIDFQNRTNQNGAPPGSGSHGDGVAGVWAGAGNLNPVYEGAAPGAFVYVIDYLSTFLDNTLSLHQNDDVMITNSSYSNGCNDGYTTTTQRVDKQTYDNPSLLHMFSAGNSGTQSCGYGAGIGWGNITGGHKQGKNVIAVANLFADATLVNSSSRGPAHDGRLKPDLAAHGQNQISIAMNNSYQTFGGTSAAAPSTAGVMTQLYQAYRELNGNNDPESPLIKAIAMNSANDLGNPGPDYKFGWGLINGLGAVEILEQNQYFDATISQTDTNTHTITVPSGLKQLRVMVYWMDKEASPNAAPALVNNLDMDLTTPGGTLYNPLILNPAPNPVTLDAPAIQGIDNLNNVEQVRIDDPAAGTYTLKVRGKTVPFGPQKYYVVYYYIKDEIRITYPNGGEGFVPGETERIHWDAFGNTGNFTLKYSTDNGNSWSNITTNVAGDLRLYEWTVPNTVSGEVLINVSRGSLSDTSDYTFSIVELPQNISFSKLCLDTLVVSWDAVPGATGYDIFRLGNQYMDSIGSSSVNSFKVPNFTIPTSDDWFAVRAKGMNGLRGRRSNAELVNSLPNCFDIGVAGLEGDLNFSILSSCFSDTSYVSVIIKNHSLNSISGFDVSYQINNGSIITETFSGSLLPFDSTVYQFSTPEVLPSGTNTIISWTSLTNDELPANDTTSNQVLISNQPTLVAPFTENFEGQSNCGTSSNCGNEICNLTGGWVNATNFSMDNIDWRVDNGGTPSNGTGPSIDHNPGTFSGRYLYTEASNGCEGQLAELYSPCIDVGGMLNPILSFWYHMEGGDMGELHVDIYDGNQLYLDVITPLSGDQGPLWLEGQIPLALYDSLIQIRFRGITGNGFTSDLAIDDISIQDFAQAPVTDFTADKTFVCSGEAVSFTDLSTFGPTSHNWVITPQVIYTSNTDSTSADPFVIFPVSGFYQVTLITTNAFGSDTTTKVNYIEAGDGTPIPVTEDFQAAGFPPVDWQIENPDGSFTWEERNVVGATGAPTSAAYVNNFSYNGAGEEDFLISFPVDLTTAVNPILTFDVAYVRYNATFEDELRIDLSDDCGDTYNQVVYAKAGATLATAPDQTTSWQPFSSTQWRKDTVDLTGFVGERIVLRFVNITGYGNGLYIDNINIDEAIDVPPTASFTYSAGPICLGTPVNFTSNSTGSNLFYSWQFGIGATPATSSSSGPISVSYSSDGMKTITLIVANALGLDTISQTIFVQPQPTVGFTATSTGANTFDFTNTSTGISTQTWDFGDGNTSTLANPSHTYMANGAYQVKLYGVGDCGTDSANQFITVTGITVPTADFVADNGNLICEGDSVTFTDMSTGIAITSYDWFFGLGANPTTANTPGPHTVVYTIGGTKTISLTVTNSEGANVKSTMITVDSLPVADYSYALSGGFQTYAFTNNSLAGVTYNWDFGDGNLSGDKNPVHTFTTNGSYDVTLVIENSCGKDTMIQTIDITNVGISQALSGVTVRVFPNPNKGVFQLQIEGSDPAKLEGEIVDIRGRTIQKLDIEHLGLVSQHAVQLSVAKGIYILNLKKGNQETHLRILVD